LMNRDFLPIYLGDHLPGRHASALLRATEERACD
jgi:hypothetical protein